MSIVYSFFILLMEKNSWKSLKMWNLVTFLFYKKSFLFISLLFGYKKCNRLLQGHIGNCVYEIHNVFIVCLNRVINKKVTLKVCLFKILKHNGLWLLFNQFWSSGFPSVNLMNIFWTSNFPFPILNSEIIPVPFQTSAVHTKNERGPRPESHGPSFRHVPGRIVHLPRLRHCRSVRIRHGKLAMCAFNWQSCLTPCGRTCAEGQRGRHQYTSHTAD